RHEFEVDDFPRNHVENTSDQGYENSHRKGARESDLAIAHIFSIRADAEEHQHEPEDYGGIADDDAFIETDFVYEGQQDSHQRGHYEAADQSKGQDNLFQGSKSPFVESCV